MNGDTIAWAAQMACLLEVSADKPGNVTRRKDFNDSCFEDFIISASAIGPAFRCAPEAAVGETILRAVKDTRRFVGVNTNLGIILMLAPLAKAVGLSGTEGLSGFDGLRLALGRVLKGLTIHDARLTYEAIRLANPGGLGRVKRHDSKERDVSITLYDAMELARERDALAREYVSNFKITFEIGLTAFLAALENGAGVSDAVVQTYLSILSRVPDTLIARKKGMDTAIDVSGKAAGVLKYGGIFSSKGRDALGQLDLELRDAKHSLNPGTTADLVAAVLFVFLLKKKLPPLVQGGNVLPGNPAIVE